jgi:arginyl-tRNA synthetase
MLAWQRYGEGKTPENTGTKGDHLVGDYYVKFDQVYKEEISELIQKGVDAKVAEKTAPILIEAQSMLLKWEEGDQEVVSLWKMMNDWVYKGFTETYKNLGVDFDKLYYESDTYLVGKQEVLKGIESGVFYKEEDGSVWVDLTDEGLDKKVLIRADGTSVYMTQDIGTAILRFKDYPALKQLIYTVGNEQNYHFKVLFIILKKLGYQWAEECKHLSYGMVELPSGKMKSREGKVVDADDLIEEMKETARLKAEELGKLDGFSEKEKDELYSIIGLGALKYYILKVDPKKQITFNPEESIDFAGNTGPFIQYTHARIKTLLSKAIDVESKLNENVEITDTEKNIIRELYRYGEVLNTSVSELNPAHLANYCYDLVKLYNYMYQTIPILKEEDNEKRNFRLYLSDCVANRIKESMSLLGITVPDRM